MKDEVIYLNPKRIFSKTRYVNAITPLTKKEYYDLDDSIKISKQVKVPLFISQDNVVLDGHHRLLSAVDNEITKIPCIVKYFETKIEELAFVIEVNLNRRQMNEAHKIINSQELFEIEQKISKLRKTKGTLVRGGAKGKTSEKISKIIGVSRSTYEKGMAIIKSKNPDEIIKWMDGKISTTTAYNNVQAIKYQENTLIKLPKEQKPILVEDPPWKYGFFEKSYNTGKTAAQHYKTMSLEELKKLQLGKLCPKDAVCFMWCTGPTINWALELMESQGFTFKTVAFVWIKTNPTHSGWMVNTANDIWMSLGNYTRPNAEYVLLGTRGKGLLRKSKSVRQVVFAPVGKHSVKPRDVMDRIKILYGDVPAYEAFARKATPGFTPLGNEVK